jgi:chorismate mutase
MGKHDYKFLLVEKSAVPEKLLKTVEAKRILASGSVTIDEAVKTAGIGRSTFYKYRDSIFPFYETTKGKVITLFFVVEDFSGVLLNIIEQISNANANIVTINQNIPISGLTDITISIETAGMTSDIGEMMNGIRTLEGLRRCEILERE